MILDRLITKTQILNTYLNAGYTVLGMPVVITPKAARHSKEMVAESK